MSRHTTRGLHILIEHDAGRYIVSDIETDCFGEGKTLYAALADHRVVVDEYHATLREYRDRLSPRCALHLRLLDGLLGDEQERAG